MQYHTAIPLNKATNLLTTTLCFNQNYPILAQLFLLQ